MSNEFFTSSSIPATGAQGSSAAIRAEFELIRAAFDKMPVLAGNAGEIVSINGTGTALEASGVTLASLVTLTSSGTITNKTFTWAGNTWTGFGSAATKNAGTAAGQVLLLDVTSTLPALDASNLTNINPTALGVIPIANGGTGQTTLAGVKSALGVDSKVESVSGVFTGNPIAPTPAPADYSERLATTKYVTDAIALVEITAGSLTLGAGLPVMDGVAAAGVAITASHSDHVHPSDTSRASTSDLTSGLALKQDADPTLTGLATMSIAAANLIPVSSGSDAFGTKTFNPSTGLGTSISTVPSESVVKTYVDAADALKAPITDAGLLGTPTCPTNTGATKNTSTTQIVNQAYLESWRSTIAAGVAVSNNNPLMNGVAAPGTSADASRVDHVHPADTTKQNTISGAATTITSSNLTVSRALVSDGSGKVGVSAATAAEVAHLSGVTSAIQTQLNAKQAYNALLASLAGQTTAANRIQAYSGVNAATLLTVGAETGNVPLVDNIVGTQTVWIPAVAMTPRTTNGAGSGTVETAINRVMIKTLDFDTAADEYAQFSIRMPKGWNEGTLTFTPVWSHPAATTNFGVVWFLQAVAVSNDDTLEVAFGTAVSSTDTGGTTDDVYVGPASAAMTVAGTPAEGDLVVFQIYRDVSDAGDTLSVDARLHGVTINYTTNALNDN